MSIVSDIRGAVRRAGAAPWEVEGLSVALLQMLRKVPPTRDRLPCVVPMGAKSGNYLVLTVYLQSGRIVGFEIDTTPDPESAFMRSYIAAYAEWQREKAARDATNPEETK